MLTARNQPGYRRCSLPTGGSVKGKDFHQNLTLSQNTDVTYTSDLTMCARQFSIEHYATETGNLSMERIERFANVNHRMGLLDIGHKPVHIGLGN